LTVLLFIPSKEAKSDIINVNGVAPLAVKSCTEAKVTDVKCHPVGEENEMHSGHVDIKRYGHQEKTMRGQSNFIIQLLRILGW
jgi:hypothetical protein